MREHEKAREPQQKGASPRRTDQQDAPEPERPVTPAEEAGQSLQEMEDPPQAEGPREDT